MKNQSVSNIDSSLTLKKLKNYPENQYLERKGIEDAGLKPTKVANEIIGMLNAGGGVCPVLNPLNQYC